MKPVKNIRVANTLETRAIEIVKCGLKDVFAWQNKIQTHIPKGEIGGKWNWPAIHLGCKFLEMVNFRKAQTYKVCVRNSENQRITVGQVILTNGYAYPGDASEKCVFIWFVASAPEAALQEFGIEKRFVVLPAIVDFAIQLSKANGYDGRIGLHAATGTPKQSADLMGKYIKLGLTQRKEQSKYFRAPFRKEDGRLFYFDENGAQAFSDAQNFLR
ncbi:hypothetical protein LC612_41305 [Nostoc sp. CHAB 5834]|nr:hypothetical protein [Nostoc sp. CHAB 5834]